jgi:NDP-sugar pyrophosphorylase family protein
LNIIGFEQPNYFIDIGVPEDYQQAQLDFIHR